MNGERYSVVCADRAGSWTPFRTDDRAHAFRLAETRRELAEAIKQRICVAVHDEEKDGQAITEEE